jgi:hypothetical protein
MSSKALVIALLGFVTAFLPNRGFAAGPSKYAILTKGQSCSLDIAEVQITSFRLLAPMEQIDKLTKDGLINVHVCECYLVGNTKKCILDAVRKAELLQSLKKDELDLLGGKMFLLIENREEFAALYMALQTGSSSAAFDLASRLLQQSKVAPPTVAPPPTSPPPPSPPTPSGHLAGDAEKRHRRCEAEPQICVKPKKTDEHETKSSDGPDVTAEFEVKCEGFPPIIVSTEGKAGFKVGPLEVSISKP